MRRAFVLLVLCTGLLMPGPARAQQIKGQKTAVLIDGVFQFQPRSWASYIIHDKENGEYYRFIMSVLDEARVKGRLGTWLEIDIDTGSERVVTRALVEKTPAGPGDLIAADVWVEGFSPFSVPDKYLKPDAREVAQFNVSHVTKRLEQRRLTFDGRSLDVMDVESQDPKGGISRALASLDVPPIGVLWVDNPQIAMYLDEWGTNAQPKITGKPVGLFEWIAEQISRGMSGEDVSLPARKWPTLKIDGIWEERDGACAGSSWTIRQGDPNASIGLAARCGEQIADQAVQSARWSTPRAAFLTLPGQAGHSGTATMLFMSDTRAVVLLMDRGGKPNIAVLRKRGG